MSGLPGGWLGLPFGDIVQLQKGKKPSDLGGKNTQRTVPYVNIAAFEKKYIAEYAPVQSIPSCNETDTLLVWDGARAGLAGRGLAGYIGSTLTKISSDLISPELLFYFVSSKYDELNSRTKGVGIPHIDPTVFNGLKFYLAPAAEQTRIVAKLDALLSELDAGVAQLKAAQKKLVQYRQSLLKAAVEGTLTAAWREAQTLQQTSVRPEPVEGQLTTGGSTSSPRTDLHNETGKQLLERILAERRSRWQAKQLAKYAAQNKPPPKDWQSKYPEPIKSDTTDLPALPQGWVWASLDMLGELMSGVTKGTQRHESIVLREVPYLRVANVQRGYLDLTEIKSIYATENDILDLMLFDGDILFNEGGDRDKLGRGWVWRNEIANCIHQNHVYRLRPCLPELESELISHHSNTFGKRWFEKTGKQTTNLASISMGVLRAFPVPVAPAIEQRAIVSMLGEQLVLWQNQTTAIATALKQSAAQRKNILKAAFAGELVPQDPLDEPASALLARIKANRAAQQLANVLAKQAKPRRKGAL